MKEENNKKITIGLFGDSFFPMADGVIMVIDNYARRLCKYANVIVFVPEYLTKKYDDSIFPYKVVRCHSVKVPFLDYSVSIPKLDNKFMKVLNKYKLDIVHVHSPFTIGRAGLAYAKKHHVPCIATMHSQFKQDFQRAVKSELLATKLNNNLIKFFDKCDECWAVNSEVARIYYEDYHYKCLPKVMNNATEMMPVSSEKEAINYINKKHNIIKFKMLYVGTGQDENDLKSYINELGIAENVIMVGKITDRNELSKYYARADLFLFPSLYDASSIVQIEAASQKTPGVFLKGSATSATVTDNVNGFISENTVGAYSDKIIEIMNSEKLFDKVKENAFIDLYVTWDKKVSEVYKIYLEKIKENKRKIF